MLKSAISHVQKRVNACIGAALRELSLRSCLNYVLALLTPFLFLVVLAHVWWTSHGLLIIQIRLIYSNCYYAVINTAWNWPVFYTFYTSWKPLLTGKWICNQFTYLIFVYTYMGKPCYYYLLYELIMLLDPDWLALAVYTSTLILWPLTWRFTVKLNCTAAKSETWWRLYRVIKSNKSGIDKGHKILKYFIIRLIPH